MTGEGGEPEEKMVGFAIASLVFAVMSTLIAVGAWYALLIWFGIFLSALMVIVIICLIVPIFALGIFAMDGSRRARKIAVIAMVLGVLGPAGGCTGGYYALQADTTKRP